MDDESQTYFRDRASAEMRAAHCATHPKAAEAHSMLAGLYLKLAGGETPMRARPRPLADELGGHSAVSAEDGA